MRVSVWCCVKDLESGVHDMWLVMASELWRSSGVYSNRPFPRLMGPLAHGRLLTAILTFGRIWQPRSMSREHKMSWQFCHSRMYL